MQVEMHTTDLHNSGRSLIVGKPFYPGTGKKGTECIQNKLDGCQLTIRRPLCPFCVCEHSMGENVFTKNMTTASDIAYVRIN